MAEQREVGLLGGIRIVSVVAAAGWWVLSKDDEDVWRREPLAAWGLIDDGRGVPFVVGLSADGLDVVELCDHPARYVHESTFPACSCARSKVSTINGFCSTCAGVSRRAA